jgi:hypothetical protein
VFTARYARSAYIKQIRFVFEGLKTQLVPHSKHLFSVMEISQLMLCREIVAVCSQIQTKTLKCNQGPKELFLKSQNTWCVNRKICRVKLNDC